MTARDRHWLSRSLVVVTAAALVLLSVSVPLRPAGAQVAMVRLQTVAPAATPEGATAIGALPGSERVGVEVVLGAADPSAITHLLRAQYEPASPDYHRWLARGAFARRFAPSAAAVSSVETWLRSLGASVGRASTFAVRATLTASRASAGFATTLERYRERSGAVGFRALRSPLVPADLAGGTVQAILGLDTLQGSAAPALATAGAAVERRSTVAASASAGGSTACAAAQDLANEGYWTDNDLGSAYGIGSLLADGQDGRGETIGLYELSAHSVSDVEAYESCFGLSNAVTTVEVDGGGTPSTDGTAEADIDIEQAATQAPDASMISYEGPNTASGAYDTWSAIVTADRAQVVSSSWGSCEPDAAAAGEISAYTTLFEQAAAQGQTVLVASGDSGSEGCFASDGTTSEEVQYPASDPWVAAVGGTTLYTSGDETAWNACQDDESVACADQYGGKAAGGGGMSRYEPRPAFQPGILSWASGADPCGTSCREVPDLSANAGVPMVSYVAGGWSLWSGTSLAAPLVAGMAADIDDGCTQPLGLLTPGLYALAAEGVYGSAMNEITAGNTDMTGSNGGAYPATAGYNAATGLGSPRAAGLSCPEITSVEPDAAPPGSTVTVSGLGLEKAAISFGPTAATVVSQSATSATVVVPDGTGAATVGASDPIGSGSQAAAFTYAPGLSASGGGGQSARAGTAFATALSARVTAADGQPDAGARVTFRVEPAGAASFPGGAAAATETAGADGSASAPTLTAGSTARSFSVVASSPDVASTAVYELTVRPDEANLTVTLSGPRRAGDGTDFRAQLTIRNAGPSPARSIQASLGVPSALQAIRADRATRAGSELTWHLARLTVGGLHSYTVELRVRSAAARTAKLTAAITSPTAAPHSSNRAATTIQLR